jgi:Tol biopolymer transport system component
MPAGKLVFAAGNVGDYDIFLYDFASGKLTQLTSDTAWNDYPRFSPDASKIAFGTTRSGKQEIWTMNADGSCAKPLTAALKWADFPTWSPDGKEIAFVSSEYFQMDIFSIHLETGKLSRWTGNDNFDCYPDWSPDGRHIAYSSQRGMHQDIYILDLATLEEKRMTTHPGPDTSPSFSPDGKRIAFVSQRPNQNRSLEFMRSFSDFFLGNDHTDIWTVELSTGSLKQMTTNRGVDRNARWSPDGKYLAYTSSSVDKADARIMICEVATDKITPLRFDESTVRNELERPFIADLNKPMDPSVLAAPVSKFDDILYKFGLKMTPHLKGNDPAWEKGIRGKYEEFEKICQQRVIDKLHPITARYLDWK